MPKNVSGTIIFNTKVSDLTTYGRFSDIMTIGNIPWKLLCKWTTEKDVEYLGVYAYCNDKISSNLWSCDVKYDIHLMRGNDKGTTSSFDHCFSEKNISWGRRNLIEKSALLLPANGYVVNDTIKIVAEIEIKSSTGFRRVQMTDFSTPQNINSEIVLLVGDRKLYVNKNVLTSFSPVFDEMFNYDFLETNKEEPLKGIVFEHYVYFLRILHRIPQEITANNVEGILKLADKYDVQFLMDMCQDFLIATKDVSKGEKLRLAEIYKFSDLQDKVLKSMSSVKEIREMRESIEQIGNGTAKALLDKSCELSKWW